MELISLFRGGAFTFGLIGILFGLTAQAIRNYKQGESRMHLTLNGPLMLGSFCRGGFFYLSGEYMLMSLDMYAFIVSAILTFQSFGVFLRPKVV